MTAQFNAAFWKWFGQSKIANDDGPIVAYHGTPFDFSTFSEAGKRSSFERAPDSVEGFFFTFDPSLAEEFTWHQGEKRGSIMPVYLSIQHPYVDETFTLTPYTVREFAELIKRAKRRGHDGVVAFMEFYDKKSSVIVAFDKRQIKSATGNDGTWDADDPSIVSNPPPTAAQLVLPFVHGTSSDEAGHAILASGHVLPSTKATGGFLRPVSGYTYASHSLTTAAIYALGGVFMGREMPERFLTDHGRYGWIFELDRASIVELEPDEDEVGLLLASCLDDATCKLPWLRTLAERYVAPSRLRQVKFGMISFQASVGKQLLKKMTPSQRSQILDHTENAAIKGAVPIVQAWRLDKTRSAEIAEDGSNVLQIAELVPLQEDASTVSNPPSVAWDNVLVKSQRELRKLLLYLIQARKIHPNFIRVQVKHDPEEDERNQGDARGFCHVTKGSHLISCSLALDALEAEVRIGILLHEIGHMAKNAFNGDVSEVDADLFCVQDIPEAGFTYEDAEYISPWTGESVIGYALERVSPTFLRLLGVRYDNV